MKLARPRRLPPALIPALIGLLLLAAIAVLPVTVPRGDDVAVTQAKQPAGGIAKDVTVTQELPATGKAIRSLGLLLGTYKRANRGTLEITLEAQSPEGQWQPLATRTVAKAALPDSQLYTLAFTPPLAVTIDQPLRITLRSADNLDFDNAVTWWTDPEWKPPSVAANQPPYRLFVDGAPRSGAACFTITYTKASGRLFQTVTPLWERMTVFLNPAWSAALLAALALFAASFLVIGQRVPDGEPAPRRLPSVARLMRRKRTAVLPAHAGWEGQGSATVQSVATVAARAPVYSSAAERGVVWRLGYIVSHRNLIWELTARNLKVRYRRSVFGFLWAVLNPLLNALVYALVFAVLLRSPIDRFVLFILIALLVWQAFSASVLESMNIVTGSASLVARVHFPHEVLPMAVTLTNTINLVLALPSVLVVMALTHTPLQLQVIYLPVVILSIFCFSLGIAFVAAATNVFFRDTRNFLDVVMTLWFFLTPIIYDINQVFPRGQRVIYWANPPAALISSLRLIFYHNAWPDPTFLARMFVSCVATMIAGWLFFIRLSPRFVEEL